MVRIPTKEDFEELLDNCDVEEKLEYGYIVVGYTLKSKSNGNSIYLPFNSDFGYFSSSTLDRIGILKNGKDVNGLKIVNYKQRRYGNKVRAICKSDGNKNGHEAVDMGLPSGNLLATSNVGATDIEDVGDYYASWGKSGACQPKNMCKNF